MTTYFVVIEKNLLAAGEPAIQVRQDDRSGAVLGTFSALEIDGPSRIITCDGKLSVWLLTEASWKGSVEE